MDDKKKLEVEYKAMRQQILSQMGSNDEGDRDLLIYSFEQLVSLNKKQRKIATFGIILGVIFSIVLIGIPIAAVAYFYRRHLNKMIDKYESFADFARKDPNLS